MSTHHNNTEPNEKYEFFDKTADAKFQAYGNTLEETFKNAEEAMMSLMYDVDELAENEFDREIRDIIVEGNNLETLLYNFLEEIIFLMSAELVIGLIYKIQILHQEDSYKLKAIIHGTQSLNLESHGEIKAVTYNEMYVKFDEDSQRYVAQVVVDL